MAYERAGRDDDPPEQQPAGCRGAYWTLWKLPMFSCTDAAQVLREVGECRREYPDAYLRFIAFDSSRQCQCMSFVIHKPSSHAPAAACTGFN